MKIGDVVKIKAPDKDDVHWVDEMNNYVGELAVISKIIRVGFQPTYNLKGCAHKTVFGETPYNFIETDLELIKEAK